MKPGDLVKITRNAVYLYGSMEDFKMAKMLRSELHSDPTIAVKDEVAMVLEIGQFKYANGNPWGCVPKLRFMDGRIGYCNEYFVALVQEPDK